MPLLKNQRWEQLAQALAVEPEQRLAGIKAGYKPKGASQAVNRALHSHPEINARVAEIQGRAAIRAEVAAADVLKELAKLGFANMLDYVRPHPQGYVSVDLSALTRDQAAAISEVTVEQYTVRDGASDDAEPLPVRRIKFKLADKRGALELLGKHLGLFKERIEHSGNISLDGLTDDQLRDRLAGLLSAVPASPIKPTTTH